MEGPTQKEKEFFNRVDRLWEKTPELLKALAIIIMGGVIGFVLTLSVYGFIDRFDIDINGEHKVTYKCPADYDTKEEYTESLEQYIKNTSENNPGITEEELSQKRMDWFISMKCEKSPWGEKGPWTYTQDYEIYVDGEIGFSFKYPNYLFIEKDPNIPNMLIIMPERLKTTDEPFTSISITVEENSNLLTPFEWLKQEAIGSSRAKPFDAVDIMKEYLDDYQIETIDGQQAIFIDGGLWVVVNTPNQKWRISISPLLDERSGASALFRETEIIVNSFSFLEPWAI